MLAAVTTDMGIIAVHRTFLWTRERQVGSPNGQARAGTPGVGARLAPAVQGRLVFAEGIESALSAMQLFGIPCWRRLETSGSTWFRSRRACASFVLFIDNDAGAPRRGASAEGLRCAWIASSTSRAPASSGFDGNDEPKSRLRPKT